MTAPVPDHRCPWPGCIDMVPAHLWGCRDHWYRLPRGIRRKIFSAYRLGQTVATASSAYLDALADADRWMVHEVAQTRASTTPRLDRVLAEAEAALRSRGAADPGDGDPRGWCACGDRALDGKATCGRVQCGPSTGRRVRA